MVLTWTCVNCWRDFLSAFGVVQVSFTESGSHFIAVTFLEPVLSFHEGEKNLLQFPGDCLPAIEARNYAIPLYAVRD